MGKLSIAGVIVIAVSFLLQLIGFATPYWVNVSLGNGGTSHSGLWQICFSSPLASKCTKLTCDALCPDSFKAAQAMATLGFLSLLVAVVAVSIKTFKLKESTICWTVGIVACFVGAACALIGTIVYATQTGMVAKDLHFSFAFCIIAGIGGIVSGVLQVLLKND